MDALLLFLVFLLSLDKRLFVLFTLIFRLLIILLIIILNLREPLHL